MTYDELCIAALHGDSDAQSKVALAITNELLERIVDQATTGAVKGSCWLSKAGPLIAEVIADLVRFPLNAPVDVADIADMG